MGDCKESNAKTGNRQRRLSNGEDSEEFFVQARTETKGWTKPDRSKRSSSRIGKSVRDVP